MVAVFLLLLLLSVSSESVLAADYFVSPAGSDANAGRTLTDPFRTISKAAGVTAPGDTVWIRGGVYHEAVNVIRSGIAGAPITFSAYQDEIPVIDGGGNLPGDLNTGLWGINADNIVVAGLTVQNSTGRGININGSFNLIEKNKVLNTQHAGLHNSSGSNNKYLNNEVSNAAQYRYTDGWPSALGGYRGSNNLWKGNFVHDNQGEGVVPSDGDRIVGNIFRDNWSINVYLDEVKNVLVEGNFIYETDTAYIPVSDANWRKLAHGIQVGDEVNCVSSDNIIRNNIVINTRSGFGFYPFHSCSGLINTLVENNTFVNSWDYGLRLLAGAHTNAIFRNNIIYPRQGIEMTVESAPGLSFTNNLFFFPGGNSGDLFLWAGSGKDFNSWNNQNGGGNNFWGNPQFVGDITAGPAGYRDTYFQLLSASPAIDRGAGQYAPLDYWAATRPQGAGADIGAHEFSGPSLIAGDLNGDGRVDILDLRSLLNQFTTIFSYNVIGGNFGR